MLIVNETVSPVQVCRKDEHGKYNIFGDVIGTCFSIGGGFCMTAGHVIKELQAREGDNIPTIATPIGEVWKVSVIQELEVIGADVGILKCDSISDQLPKLTWNIENLKVLADVRTFGYAYGTHTIDSEHMIVARGFKGAVACTLPRFKPIGFDGPAFSIHELSFPAPRGLSGAPLLDDVSETVKGIVIGNSVSEMLVSSDEEKDSNGDSVSIVERVERLTLGIAVRAVHITSLNSTLLKGPVPDHLKKYGLLS